MSSLYSEAEIKAQEIWKDFENQILHNNRYFIQHPVLDMIKNYVDSNKYTINKGEIFYRARIIDEAALGQDMMYLYYGGKTDENILEFKNFHSVENKFRGLTKDGCFVPPDNNKIKEGRANPKFIKYLYLSEKPATAIFEVRPLLTDRINIAEIIVNEPLEVASIGIDLNIKNGTHEEYVLLHIQSAFSKPTYNPDDYIRTQIIAEYIKTLGFDGIRFNSSLHRGGVNLTIYNYEKCEPISSQDYRIEDLKITARPSASSDPRISNFWWIRDNEEIPYNYDEFKKKYNDVIVQKDK